MIVNFGFALLMRLGPESGAGETTKGVAGVVRHQVGRLKDSQAESSLCTLKDSSEAKRQAGRGEKLTAAPPF